MKALALVLLLAVAACKPEVAQDVSPVALTSQSVGYYCQMLLVEHDGPKGQIHLAGQPGAPLFFAQVRDTLAYLRMPEQSHAVLAVWVNDMGAPGASWATPGADNWIRATDAVFVVGARVTGGMGAPEVVPFSDAALAAVYARQKGGAVMSLDEIPDVALLAPVDTDGAAPGPGNDTDFEQRLRALSRKTGG